MMLEIEPRPLGMLDMDFTNSALFTRQFFCVALAVLELIL